VGSSNLDYRGSGFWVRDYQAETWLYLLAQQAQATACPPPWLAAAATDWHEQATTGFTGCVSSCLEDHLGTDPDRVAVTVSLSERALERLSRWSPAIPGMRPRLHQPPARRARTRIRQVGAVAAGTPRTLNHAPAPAALQNASRA
jgi:hypothetical protein